MNTESSYAGRCRHHAISNHVARCLSLLRAIDLVPLCPGAYDDDRYNSDRFYGEYYGDRCHNWRRDFCAQRSDRKYRQWQRRNRSTDEYGESTHL